MKRRLRIGALSLACFVGLSVPLAGAGAVGTSNIDKSCRTVHYDETKLVWNAQHTKKTAVIVYKIVPETAPLDGYKTYLDVAVAVVVTHRVCPA